MTDEHGPWVAVVNWGRWVTECPRPGCSYAYSVDPGQDGWVCQTTDGDGCGYMARVEWPQDAATIAAVLTERPLEKTRNWAPVGHRQTQHSRTIDGRIIAEAYPEGQDVSDLMAESRAAGDLPSPTPDLRQQAAAAMAALGLEFDPATGLVKGL
jgi:hypothetical protein